jgi:hypothetical protein
VDLKLNVRYVAPADRGASWYASSLAELRRSRAKDPPIRIELRGGGVVGGFLDETSESPCVIYLEDQHPIPCVTSPCSRTQTHRAAMKSAPRVNPPVRPVPRKGRGLEAVGLSE